MPSLGVLFGSLDLTYLKWILNAGDPEGEGLVAITYGVFIQYVVDFLIIAGAIFMAIRGLNSLKKKEEEAPAAPPEPTKEEVLLTEIRDILKENKNPNV